MAIKQGDKLKTKRGVSVEIIYAFPVGKTDLYGNAIFGLLDDEDGGVECWGWTSSGAFHPGKAGAETRPCGLDLALPATEVGSV